MKFEVDISVIILKRCYLIIFFIFLVGFTFSQTTYYSRQNGKWTVNSTWSTVGCGGAAASNSPGATDNVVICSDNTVTVNANCTINDVNVNSRGLLSFGSWNLTLNGDLVIDGSVLGQNGTIILTGGNDISGTGTIKSNNHACFTINSDITISAIDLSVYSDIDSDIIEIGNGMSVTNNGVITVRGHITGLNASSTWINAADSELTVSGDMLLIGTLYASASGNTINYSGTIAGQNIKTPIVSTYNNLIVSGSEIKEQQSDLIINGDLSISSGTHDCNNFDINIKGDWSCNGAFTYDTKVVVFDGTDNQSITNIDTQTFYDLTIDKSSGTVNLNSNVEVINELDMTQGNVNTGVNKITLGTSITDYGTLIYSSGQVIGKYEKWFVQSEHDGNAQIFPVGIDSYYRPISATITISGVATSGGSIISEFLELNPGNDGLALQDSPQTDPDSVYNTFIDGYWSLTDANGISIADYDLQLTGNGFNSFTIESETRLLTRANYASDWTNEGTHVNAVSYTAKRSGLSSLPAEFCFADDTYCTGPITPPISGDDDVCTDDEDIEYSVANTSGSTYTWTITGGSIVSGQGTDAIYVDWGSTGMLGKVEVVEWNSCTCGLTESLDVIVNTIQPAFILGLDIVPVEQTGVAYSVIDTLGYSYTWAIDGGSVASGQGTNSITADWDVNDGWGSVSVYASGSCDDSPDTELDVWKYIVINSIATGNWGNSSTWDCNCSPLETDNVRINDGHTVSVNTDLTTVKNFTVTAAGVLDTVNRTFIVTGHVLIDGSCTGTRIITFSGNNTTIGGMGLIENVNSLEISGGNKTILSNSVLRKTGGDLDIVAGLIVKNYGSFTIETGDIILNAGSSWKNEQYSTLEIGNAITPVIGTLYASATGNIVNYFGSDDPQIIRTTTYYDLYVTKTAGTIGEMNGDITVNNDFNIYSGTASTGLNAIEVKGNTNIDGTLHIDDVGTKIFKNVYINSGGTWNNSANEAVLIKGDIQNDGTFTSGLNTYTLSGFANTVSGTNSLSFNLINTSGKYTNLTTVSALNAMQGTGTWTQGVNSYLYIGAVNTTVSTFDAGTNVNTVNYSFAGNQFVRNATYYHLITSGGTGTKTLEGTVIVNGNYTNETGVICDASINDYNMFMRGNWTNNGTFNPQEGKVTFDGTIVQTISGTNSTAYYDIEFDNDVGNNADIMIEDNDISIGGFAEFTDGIVNTGDNTVVFLDGSTSEIGKEESFIDGNAQKSGASSFTFPIGDITDRDIGDGLQTYKIWAPFTADPAASTDVKIKYLYSYEYLNQWWYTAWTHEFPLTHTTNREYWLVSSTEDLDVILYWKNNDPCTIHDFCDGLGVSQLEFLSVAYWDNIWKDAGGDARLELTTDGSITSSISIPFAAKGEKQITFGGRNSSIPLPIELLDFYVDCDMESQEIDILWTTSSERNNDFFTIERSNDALSWETIGTVKGAGNSSDIIDYEFYDTNPLKDISYYRLKQTDYNGNYKYSDIISMYNCFGVENQLTVFPNPANDIIKISVLYNTRIEIINLNGQILQSFNVNGTNVPVDISNLSSGLYILKASSNDGIIIEKLIIE